MSYQKTILLGRLGEKPELKVVSADFTVCNFTVATNETWFDKKSNEKKEKVTWHRVNATGKTAENCARYLDKGSSVLVDGIITNRSYEKDGSKVYVTEIKAHSVQFLDSKKGNDGAGYEKKESAPTIDATDLPF
jgi:single-strand DNA-binding protein